MQGNGQTELTEAILGLQEHVSGSINLDGDDRGQGRARQILDAGVGFIPEDRQDDGLVGGFSIAENLMLNRSFNNRSSGGLAARRLREFAQKKLNEYDVRAPTSTRWPPTSPAATSRRSSSPASCAAT